MENRGDADAGAEVLGVGGDGDQGLGRCLEQNYGDTALNSQRFSVAITDCVASHVSEISQHGCDKATRRANHPKPVQPSREKYFCFSEMQIRLLIWASHPARGALRTSRTRGGMRWTRMLRLTSAADADGKSVWF
jgi:hypothetical protein